MASGFVGVEAVIADGLFAFGREVVDDGGDEVGGFEDFEVALGGVVALGAVDDGLGDEVVAEGVDGGDDTEFAIGEIEAGAEDFLESLGGGFEEEVECAEGFTVLAFVVGEEFVPAVANELPEGRGAGTARLLLGRHKECF